MGIGDFRFSIGDWGFWVPVSFTSFRVLALLVLGL